MVPCPFLSLMSLISSPSINDFALSKFNLFSRMGCVSSTPLSINAILVPLPLEISIAFLLLVIISTCHAILSKNSTADIFALVSLNAPSIIVFLIPMSSTIIGFSLPLSSIESLTISLLKILSMSISLLALILKRLISGITVISNSGFICIIISFTCTISTSDFNNKSIC